MTERTSNMHAAASLRDETVITDPFVEAIALRSLVLTRFAQTRGERRAARGRRARRRAVGYVLREP